MAEDEITTQEFVRQLLGSNKAQELLKFLRSLVIDDVDTCFALIQVVEDSNDRAWLYEELCDILIGMARFDAARQAAELVQPPHGNRTMCFLSIATQTGETEDYARACYYLREDPDPAIHADNIGALQAAMAGETSNATLVRVLEELDHDEDSAEVLKVAPNLGRG